MIKARDMQVFEILEEVSKLPTDDQKVQYLQSNFSDHTPLQYVLKFNFCDTIRTVLPEGAPPFNDEKEDGPSTASLWAYLKHFPMFVVSAQSQNMKAMQRERIFIEMLEAVDPEEAKMFCLAKDKDLESRYDINVDVARAAFPAMQIQSTTPPREKTPEERADALKSMAESKKAEAKKLNAEAKELLSQAKTLLES